jgi:hypothetical protein
MDGRTEEKKVNMTKGVTTHVNIYMTRVTTHADIDTLIKVYVFLFVFSLSQSHLDGNRMEVCRGIVKLLGGWRALLILLCTS